MNDKRIQTYSNLGTEDNKFNILYYIYILYKLNIIYHNKLN